MAFADFTTATLASLVSLEGRAAVVTGGGQGIGYAVASRLAEAGAAVLVVDKHRAVAAAAEIAERTGAAVHGLVGDVRESSSLEAAADHAIDVLGGLDVWVNDAGIFPVGDAVDVTDDDWHTCIATDLTGPFFGARAAARRMRRHGRGGVIVNISSSLSFRGVPQQCSYVAAKWGVRGLTAALAAEWGRDGIRVVAVAPGLTRSPGMLAVMAGVDAATHGDIGGQFAAQLPAQRLAEPDDIARAVLFAASDLGGFLTGSTVLADGGEVYGAGATAATDA